MKLNITQSRILAAAAARSDGQVFPLPSGGSAKGRDNAIQPLLEAAFVVSVSVPHGDQVWRIEGKRKLGLIITQSGRDIIAAEQDGVNVGALPETAASEVAADTPAGSKIGQVLALLCREQGAGLEEIGRITGWLPHSVRAALTGLRKKGHLIERQQRGPVTVYTLMGGMGS